MMRTPKGSIRMLTLAAGTAAVLTVTLTACGGSSKPSATATTATTSKSASTPTSVANPAADKATAESLGLVQADLPAGWVGTPSQNDAEDAQVNKKVADCTGASAPSKQTADVNSDDFDKGNAQVSSEVTFAASRADFEQDVAAVKNSDKYTTCVKTIFESQLKADFAKNSPGVDVGPLTVTRVSTPTYGEVSFGFTFSTTITGTTGEALRYYIDEIGYGKGRAEVQLTFTNQSARFDPALEKSLVANAAAKLKTSAA
jgi:hypothetical protein